MTSWYFLAVGLSFGLAVILTLVVRRLAYRWRVVDDPGQAPERKHHGRPVALLGGLAIIFSSQFTWLTLNHFGALAGQPFPAKFFYGFSARRIGHRPGRLAR